MSLLNVRDEMWRVRLEHDIDQERYKGVGSLFGRQQPDQACVRRSKSASGPRMKGVSRTKDDLARVHDADHLVTRRLVLIDLCHFSLREIEVAVSLSVALAFFRQRSLLLDVFFLSLFVALSSLTFFFRLFCLLLRRVGSLLGWRFSHFCCVDQ